MYRWSCLAILALTACSKPDHKPALEQLAAEAKGLAAGIQRGDLDKLGALDAACGSKLEVDKSNVAYYIEQPTENGYKDSLLGYRRDDIVTYWVGDGRGDTFDPGPVRYLAIGIARDAEFPRPVELGSYKFTGGTGIVQVRVFDRASKAMVCEGRRWVELTRVATNNPTVADLHIAFEKAIGAAVLAQVCARCR